MNKILLLVALTLTATLAVAHARLQASLPANGSTVSPAPEQLRLSYNEPVEAAMSSTKLFGQGDTLIATTKPSADPADNKTLVLPLPKLAPGDYRVQWTTMGNDGHHIKGELRFSVK